MKTYKFNKEESGRWFIDLPEYIEQGGMKEDLEMVAGADEMLDLILGNSEESSVNLILSETPIDEADGVLVFDVFGKPQFEGGAYYNLPKYQGEELDMMIWLCDVTKFVFEEGFPDEIYFKQV